MVRWIRRFVLKRRIKKARRLFRLIERGVRRAGMPRRFEKRMWRDFAKGAPGSHDEILDLIIPK